MAKSKAPKHAAKSGSSKSAAKPSPAVRKAAKQENGATAAKLSAGAPSPSAAFATALVQAAAVGDTSGPVPQITEAIKSQAGVDLTEKVKELVRLALLLG
jgi:hypothetical protein